MSLVGCDQYLDNFIRLTGTCLCATCSVDTKFRVFEHDIPCALENLVFTSFILFLLFIYFALKIIQQNKKNTIKNSRLEA